MESKGIDVRELRVGNLLRSGGVVVTIDARSIFDIWDKSKKYEPIPLDPVWLERCGFVKDNIPTTEPWTLNDVTIFMKSIHELVPAPYASFGWRYPVCIQYVHQLQNLFYSLTGNELEVKI